jgi:hypothetical protein
MSILYIPPKTRSLNSGGCVFPEHTRSLGLREGAAIIPSSSVGGIIPMNDYVAMNLTLKKNTNYRVPKGIIYET